VKSLPIDEIIYAPHQFQGVELIDIEAYRVLRRKEFEENLQLAAPAVFIGHPTIKVSHFASNEPEWARRCELKYIMKEHKFYLCPDRKED